METDAYILAAMVFRALALGLVALLVFMILAACWTGAPTANPSRFAGIMAAAVGPGNDVSRGLQSKDGLASRASADSSAGAKFSPADALGLAEPEPFCRAVLDFASEQGWSLELKQLDVSMRWVWTWTWRGAHPMPRQERLFPGRREALLAACLHIAGEAGWQFPLTVPDAPMELEQPVGLGRSVA